MIRFKHSKVIAAVRSPEDFDAALDTKVGLVFDLTASILEIAERARRAHEAGKKLLIHMDLAEGIGKDAMGMAFARSQGVDGIISTRGGMIKPAKEAGLLTVQRFFMVDSQSVKTALEALRNTRADMVEIMPGLLPKVIEEMTAMTEIPVIAGGLLETREELIGALKAGAAAVSTGKWELWPKEIRNQSMVYEN